MKQNKRFLLVAFALVLVSLLAVGVAMATPLSEIKFAASYPAETWHPDSSYYGETYYGDWISLDSWTGDELYLSWSSSDASVAEVVNAKTSGTSGVSLRVYKPGKVAITAKATDATGKEIAGVTATANLEYVLKKEESVTFSDAKVVVSKGGNRYLAGMVTVAPADASYGVDDLTWTTSDSKIAIVTNDGRVYGMKVGTATITATAKGDPTISGSITVEVKESEITALTFTESALELTKGTSDFPLYALLEADGAGSVVWTSSDSSVVFVDDNGVIDALKAGTAKITVASEKDATIKAECTITVTEKPVTGISFSQEEFTIYSEDTDRRIGKYLLTPSDGNFNNVTFATSNPEIARVSWDYDGNIWATGYAVGTATITATVRVNEETTVSGSFKINVKEYAITSMSFSKAEYKLNLNKKTNISLGGKRLIVKPDDYSALRDPDAIDGLIIWESSDDTIATVDADGDVVAHAPGKATITAKYSKDTSITASADVVIDTTPVKTFALTKKELTLTYNKYVNTSFYAQITPSNAYVKEIYYEVVDPEIATISCDTYLNQPNVSDSYVAWFNVYPNKAGTTDIKVYLDDGTTVHEAVLTVTVVKKEADLKIALADGEDESPISSLKLPLYKVASYNKRVAQLTAFDDNESYSSSEKFSVKWSSSNPSIATIDRYGRISVKKAGKVTITATTKDGTNKTATVEVQVIKNKIKKIKGTKNIALRVGETNYLSKYLKIVPTKADLDLFDWTMTYKSSNDGVVSVNDDGTIVGVKQGTAKITVKANDGSKKKFTITVNVVPQMQ